MITTINELVELMKDRAKAMVRVPKEAAQLEPEPVDYTEIAVRVANVLLDTLSAHESHAQLTEWAVEVAARDHPRYLKRLRVIATALETLHAPYLSPGAKEKVMVHIVMAVYRRHGNVPLDRNAPQAFPPGVRMALECPDGLRKFGGG